MYTLRGTISEDHIPTKQSSTSKGLSHKEIISYLTPQLDINCLKVADSKANEKILQLDEQHVSFLDVLEMFYIQWLYVFRLLKIIKLVFCFVNVDSQLKRKCIIIVGF